MKTESELLGWFRENKLIIDFDYGNVSVTDTIKRKRIFKMMYEQYPECCGIVIIEDFIMTYAHDHNIEEIITNTLLLFSIYCKDDPDSEGDSIISNVPYGMIMAAHIDKSFINGALKAGFKEHETFTNPKTQNEIYTVSKLL